MKLQCPDCGAEIPAENVPLEGGQALCLRCDRHFPLAQLLPEGRAEEDLHQPRDSKLVVERPAAEQVTVYVPSVRDWSLVVFAAVWNGFMVFVTAHLLASPDAPLIGRIIACLLVLTPFWAAGLWLAVGALFSLFGRTRVHIGNGEVVVKKELSGLGRARRYRLKPGSAARLTRVRGERNGYVWRIDTVARELWFSLYLTKDEKSWLVNVINDVLHRQPVRKGEEVLQQPRDSRIGVERPLPGQATLYIPSKTNRGILAFAIGWLGFAALWTGGGIAGDWFNGNMLLMVGFLAAFWAIGLYLLTVALFSIFGRTLVHVDGSQLVVKRELFGLGRVRRYQLSPETSASVGVAYQQFGKPVYACTVDAKDEEVQFGSFLSDEDKGWVVAVIDDVLHRQAVPTSDEGKAPDRPTQKTLDPDADLRLVSGLVWPAKPGAGRKHTLVERLTELGEARETVLTKRQYDEWRRGILDELGSYPRMPIAIQVTFSVACAALVALIVFGVLKGHDAAIWGGAAGLLAGVLMWLRSAHDYAAKRRLSRADRLAALDELVARDLVTSDEAVLLRTRIESLFQGNDAA